MQDTYRQVLNGRYKQALRAEQDILESVKRYPTLKINSGRFDPSSSRSSNNNTTNGSNPSSGGVHIYLHGTLPMQYNHHTYHIPLQIWIPWTYPVDFPIVYVEPTPAMYIKEGAWVDSSGLVMSPFQRSWTYNLPPQQKNLLMLLEHLVDLFGKQPPLFSLTRRTSGTGTEFPVQRLPLPSPPPPSSTTTGTGLYSFPSMTGGVGDKSPISFLPPPSLPPTIMMTTTPPSYHHPYHYPPSQPVFSHIRPLMPSPTPPPIPSRGSIIAAQGVFQQGLLYPHFSGPSMWDSSIDTQQRIQQALLLELMDKIYSNIDAVAQQLRKEIDALLEKKAALEQNSKEGYDIMQKLIDHQNILTGDAKLYRSELENMKQHMERYAVLDQLSVYELIQVQSFHYHQAFELVASINALEDVVYHLGKALNSEKVGLQPFIKNVRILAREIFIKKALLQKIKNIETQ